MGWGRRRREEEDVEVIGGQTWTSLSDDDLLIQRL